MPYIIGTAGHIDHGKTSLIKALTGQDTDRLKEEKERGISIDLGFAYLDLPDGSRAGVVDVPGHERFIHNMLAGAHGIDLVLFTVAADDGVMPQTEEHLDILHLLGIARAIFVITKTDLASESRIREVEEEIQILASGTSLENSPVVRFSFLTGAGLEQLRAQIVKILQESAKRETGGYFRLPVDRVFALQGHGLIVTGTALSGEISVGERVRCLPGDQLFRIRSLHVHNQAVALAQRGQRVAINLSGQEKPSIERGHVICHEAITLTTSRFDAFLEVRPTAAAGIKNHQRVRVHLGTAERLGKLILLGPDEKIGPKKSGYCQITLSDEVLALRRDHFIVRDETAQRTLAGGIVIHPWAKKHKRADPTLPEMLRALHKGAPDEVIGAFLNESDEFAMSLGSLYQFLNLRKADVQELVGGMPTIRPFNFEGETGYSTETKWQRLTEQVQATLKDFHATHPLAAGMDMEELRDKLAYSIAPKLFRAFVEQLEGGRVVVREANLLYLPDHKVHLRGEEHDLVEKIKSCLRVSPLMPPDLKQLERDLGIARPRLLEVLKVMERERSVVRVATDLYFLGECIEQLKGALRKELAGHREVTPSMFRDLFGTSRKYTIPLLEYFDREGVTVRVGDVRRLKSHSVTAGR